MSSPRSRPRYRLAFVLRYGCDIWQVERAATSIALQSYAWVLMYGTAYNKVRHGKNRILLAVQTYPFRTRAQEGASRPVPDPLTRSG